MNVAFVGFGVDAFVEDDVVGVEVALQGAVIGRFPDVRGADEPDGGAATVFGNEFADGDLQLDGVRVGIGDAGVRLRRREVGLGGRGAATRRDERRQHEQQPFPHKEELSAKEPERARRETCERWRYAMELPAAVGYFWGMAQSRDAQRRWLGGICLGISATMLVLGLTVLKDRLRPETFVLYWLVCMLMTCLALIIALLDMRAVRMRSQREQIELVNRALQEIEREKEEKAAKARDNGAR